VRVRFDATVPPYVRRAKWHKTQTIEEHSAGIDLRMRVRSTSELLSWVLSLGQHAEVVEPEDLRDQARAELEKALTRYG
jgi:predicted DNA-binding transcriptional regulator YafY